MMTYKKYNIDENDQIDPRKKQQGPFSRTKWALVRGTLSTLGKASKGIQIGYRYGFDISLISLLMFSQTVTASSG